MKSQLQQCMLLLAHVVSALFLVSGIENHVKTVCTGDSVQAFQITDFDPCNSNVSLNINGERNILIAQWSFSNCIRNETLLKKYKDKVILNQNGTITIHNFGKFDQGRYVVISQKDVLPMMHQVDITIMEPPNKDCKPNVDHVGNMLIANIKSVDCGYPVTTAYWKDSDTVSGTDKRILKITPGNEARTYVACIEGVSLQCERSIKQIDHCTTFVLQGQNNITQSTTSCSTESPIAAIIVLAILLAIAIIVIVIMSLNLCSYRSKLKYSKTLLNHDQQQDLKTYSIFSCCSRLPSNGQKHTLEIPLGDCDKSDINNLMDEFGKIIATDTHDEKECDSLIETQSKDNSRLPCNGQKHTLERPLGDCDKSDSHKFLDLFGKNIATDMHDEKECDSLIETQSKDVSRTSRKSVTPLDPNVIEADETMFS